MLYEVITDHGAERCHVAGVSVGHADARGLDKAVADPGVGDIDYVDMRYGNGFTIGWKGGTPSPETDAQKEENRITSYNVCYTKLLRIMAGGTGGHVYPALAVARALQARSNKVVWLGTHRGLESRVVPAAGIDIEWISVKGLRRKGALALVVAPFSYNFV